MFHYAPALRRSASAPALQALLLFVFSFAVFGGLIFSASGFVGTDDYYHARISGLIIEQGRLALNFPWLPKTILSPERFVDHHLLYHLYIAPWVHFGGMTGAKLAQAGVAAGGVAAIWLLLRQMTVRWPLLWALAVFALSTPFLYRLLMIRTQGASLLLLILALLILFRGRYRWLAPLAFAYVWLYNGFVLMLAFTLLYTAAVWIAERRLEWRPVAYCALGLGLGLVINPYFPNNVLFSLDHLGAKLDFEGGVRVGSEWYPYTTGALLENSAGALLLLALGFLRPSFNGSRRDKVQNTLLFVALLTLFMLLRSRRFIEYFPAFALLFCATAWGRGVVHSWQFQNRALRVAMAAAGLGGLIFLSGLTISGTLDDARSARDLETFAGASDWLTSNTPPGALVFQTDWDDFTRLFYHNTHNVYLVGLDPTYLQLADNELWDQWVAITRGEVENPSTIIQSLFGASYIVSDRRHDDFANQAGDDSRMRLVYQDQYSLVWEISEAGSGAATD